MKIQKKIKGKKYKRRIRRNNQKKWEARDFPESPVSQKLFRYLSKKFVKTVAPIALCKCLAAVSCKLERPRVSVLHVAPSRHFKSFTSKEVMRLFDNEFWINTQSDFTIHGLERYKKKLKESRCLMHACTAF